MADHRIRGFAVFDLGGTDFLTGDSLAQVDTPLLVYGAPKDIAGLDLDRESRALVAALPGNIVSYREPEALSHFDFLGVCTDKGVAILQEKHPEDVIVCLEGRQDRERAHKQIVHEVTRFFGAL